MFPPKVVGIIGNHGQMAENVVKPFFTGTGCQIIGSDLRNPQGLNNQEVVERADIVYFSILPISRVAPAIRELIPFGRPDTSWLHGTSIQNPVSGSIIAAMNDKRLLARGVCTGFLHFMVGPMIRSLRGQSIVYGFLNEHDRRDDWKNWLVTQLQTKRPILIECSPESHDALTTESQIIPMLTALLAGQLWRQQDVSLSDALQVAGPPCWLQTYGILRNLGQSKVIAEILVNHPHTREVVEAAKTTLHEIEEACRNNAIEKLARTAREGLTVISEEKLAEIKRTTDWHIRLEGDLRGGAVCFVFSQSQNKLGLLTSVLRTFDQHQLDKTSCMAQELPDGSCRFYIGLKEITHPNVRKACEQVVADFGGEILVEP